MEKWYNGTYLLCMDTNKIENVKNIEIEGFAEEILRVPGSEG